MRLQSWTKWSIRGPCAEHAEGSGHHPKLNDLSKLAVSKAARASFSRLDTGDVLVQFEVEGVDGVEHLVGATFTPSEWAGHVACVSPVGLTESTHAQAMRFHGCSP